MEVLGEMPALPIETRRKGKMVKVWILTSEYNLYDQQGEYFERAFAEKPTLKILADAGVPGDALIHVMNGGGRVADENMWFFLREVDA